MTNFSDWLRRVYREDVRVYGIGLKQRVAGRWNSCCTTHDERIEPKRWLHAVGQMLGQKGGGLSSVAVLLLPAAVCFNRVGTQTSLLLTFARRVLSLFIVPLQLGKNIALTTV